MKMAHFILMLISLIGCSKPVLEIHGFETYVAEFEKESAIYGKPIKINNLKIFYDNPSGGDVAFCTMDVTPRIQVREEIWKMMQEKDRKYLLFHEMGHCVLGREHNNEASAVGKPLSIMNEFWPNHQTIEADYDFYMRELFSK